MILQDDELSDIETRDSLTSALTIYGRRVDRLSADTNYHRADRAAIPMSDHDWTGSVEVQTVKCRNYQRLFTTE